MTQTSGEVGQPESSSARAETSLRGRIARFIREVVAELRKVIWPTRKELVTYTVVVIIFVAVIVALVGGLDFGFAKAALAVFGGGGKP